MQDVFMQQATYGSAHEIISLQMLCRLPHFDVGEAVGWY
jgi:hypothetical protein